MTTLKNGVKRSYAAQCEGKMRWETKAAAKLAKQRGRGFQWRDSLAAYRCPHCNGFHLGHKPAKGAA